MQLLTRCASLAAWSSAVLRGEVGVEHAMDALRTVHCEPLITTTTTEPAEQPDRFALTVGRWRSLGVSGWRYVPAAPADSQALPEPLAFRARAIDAGAALVSVSGPSLGLVPISNVHQAQEQKTSTFTLHETPTADYGTASTESVSDLDRALLSSLTEAIDILEALDLASWRDDIRDLLLGWGDPPYMPPGTPDRAQRLAARSERVLALIELASDDEGGSRTAAEMSHRASTLREVGRTARAAHAAAWNTGVIDASTRR